MMNNIAVILARSGSKGLPDKNILPLCGKPLLAYSIEAARASGKFDLIHVSTDSERYADIARQYGADVPFLRSAAASSDTASSWDAIREVLTQYAALGQHFDRVMLLQPTSPLRTGEDIIRAFQLLDSDTVNVVSVTEVEHPVQWCFTLPENQSMDDFAKSPYNAMRRQELAKHYRENGSLYLVDAKKIMDPAYDLYADHCRAYVMPADRSIDIDTKLDFAIAEVILTQTDA